ncbi:MAG: hypothetical protein WBB36_01410 [Chitinophagales bacterium]
MNKKNGFWQFDKMLDNQVSYENQINDHFTFYYNDDEVIVRLTSTSPSKWESSDGIYRLKAKWESDKLFYLSPMGEWIELATYEDGRFVQCGIGKKKLFRKINIDEIAAWNKDFAKEDRLQFEYSSVPGSRFIINPLN